MERINARKIGCSGGRIPLCKSVAADTAASTERESAAQRLSWRGFAVCQNFSDRRRKVVHAGAGHYDAVPASVSFFGDAQESPAVVLPEFHVEMLALDLQFSRLDDVIHFSLRPPTLPQSNRPMEEKSALGIQIFWAAPFPPSSRTSALRSPRDLDRLTATESRTLPRHVLCP